MIDRSTETNEMKRMSDDMLMPPVQTNEISHWSTNTVPWGNVLLSYVKQNKSVA